MLEIVVFLTHLVIICLLQLTTLKRHLFGSGANGLLDRRLQTTDYEQRVKVISTLNRHKISFKKIRDALVLTCDRRTAIQNVIAREACVEA